MKKILFYLLFVATIILLIAAPFLIEKIILCEDIFPFNMPITFSKETWFGFIASYLGAIGTVSLGIIALYQNKKYKELSDSSEERLLTLQTEIKNLTEKNVALIELNSKIERAKYFPILTNAHHSYWDMSKANAKSSFDFENDAFVFSYKNISPEEIPNTLIDIFNQYHTFVYTLKNDGERTIRNFSCTSVTQNKQLHEHGFWFCQTCDIEPGAILRCVYVTKFNLAEQCKNGEIESLSFKYEMENVIGERFEMATDLHFIPSGKNAAPDYMMEITPIHRV
ncbi:MAG: hypothetical protein Q4F06_08490 [Eubacteriales bacterium]|nr:hypothetical protein [Eubacteriales bacterium]